MKDVLWAIPHLSLTVIYKVLYICFPCTILSHGGLVETENTIRKGRPCELRVILHNDICLPVFTCKWFTTYIISFNGIFSKLVHCQDIQRWLKCIGVWQVDLTQFRRTKSVRFPLPHLLPSLDRENLLIIWYGPLHQFLKVWNFFTWPPMSSCSSRNIGHRVLQMPHIDIPLSFTSNHVAVLVLFLWQVIKCCVSDSVLISTYCRERYISFLN